jgi:hypothetical protein
MRNTDAGKQLGVWVTSLRWEINSDYNSNDNAFDLKKPITWIKT